PTPTALYPLSLHDALPICAADHPIQLESIVQLRAQVRVFCAQSPLLHRHIQLVQQLFELEWLGDEPLRAQAGHLNRLPYRGKPRSEEHTSELQSRVDLVCR